MVVLSPMESLACAFRAVLCDPETPKIFRDKLFLIAAQLRDDLTAEQARTVDAAEAEAVIRACASRCLTQSQTQPDAENPLDEPSGTSGAQARLLGSL